MPPKASLDTALVRLEALEDILRSAHEALRKLRHELLGATPDFDTTGMLTPLGESIRSGCEYIQVEPALQVIPPNPSWIPVLHRMTREESNHPKPCGNVGLYLTQSPTQHQKASLDVMRILVPGENTWREPTTADVPLCSSCGVWIDPFSSQDLDYFSVMVPSEPPRVKKIKATKPFPVHTREATQKDIDVLQELSDAVGLGRHDKG